MIIMASGCTPNFLGGSLFPAEPQSFNGEYYMVGDDNCWRYEAYSSNAIKCFQRMTGKYMGNRYAMSDRDLMVYFGKQQSSGNQGTSPLNTNCYRTYGGGMNCTTY